MTVPVVLVLRKSSSISSLLISVNIEKDEGKGIILSPSSSSSGKSIVLVSSFKSISFGGGDVLPFLRQQKRSITVYITHAKVVSPIFSTHNAAMYSGVK